MKIYRAAWNVVVVIIIIIVVVQFVQIGGGGGPIATAGIQGDTARLAVVGDHQIYEVRFGDLAGLRVWRRDREFKGVFERAVVARLADGCLRVDGELRGGLRGRFRWVVSESEKRVVLR